MIQVRDVLGRARPLAVAAVFTAAAILPTLMLSSASAGVLTERSLKLTSSRPSSSVGVDALPVAGGADNGDKVGHTYEFTVEQAGTVRGLRFGVYTDAFGYLDSGMGANPGAGTTGFSAANAPDAQVYEKTAGVGSATTFATSGTATGWTSANATGLALTAGQTVVVQYTATATDYFVNPSATGTFFVRSETFSTDDFSAGKLDEGTVTSAIVPIIDIETRVKETLKFMVEADGRDGGTGTVGLTNPSTSVTLPACDALTGTQSVKIGLATDDEYTLATGTQYNGYSYIRLATNAVNGTIVYYGGKTLHSGGIDFTPIGPTMAPGAVGNEQFGLRVDTALSDIQVGSTLAPEANYGTAGNFAFDPLSDGNPVPLARSTGVIACDTLAVEYIANIAEDTPAGIYTTKITYVAAPSY